MCRNFDMCPGFVMLSWQCHKMSQKICHLVKLAKGFLLGAKYFQLLLIEKKGVGGGSTPLPIFHVGCMNWLVHLRVNLLRIPNL